ncbi:MAG: S-layer protein [Candidatus Aenigmatarchaeota archaeon]
MRVIEGGKVYNSKNCKFFEESEIEYKILYNLSLESLSLKELSKRLKIYPQLLLHYIKKLEKKGFIVRNGRKYKAFKSYYQIILDIPDEKFTINPSIPPFLKSFQRKNFYVVLGSPDPHGTFSARARDNHLAFYLGQLIFTQASVKFDTEIMSYNLLDRNLIVVGGPVTNTIAYKLNTIFKVRFLQEFNWDIYSEFTNKKYSEENIGLIYYSKNPFNQENEIIWIAGKRRLGTEIAIKALPLISFDSYFYCIVEGKDLDGDGNIDKIEFLESNQIK